MPRSIVNHDQVLDPGSTSFSRTHGSNDGTATTNDHHHNLVFDPGGDSVNTTSTAHHSATPARPVSPHA
jgi:hypothetical protein